MMNDSLNNPNHTPRKILRPRRLVLLASVAGLSMAVLGVGPLDHALGRSWMTAAQASETTAQAPSGFADLVGKVKPAVISVRVKIDDGGNAQVTEQRGDNAPDQFGAPEQFFRQFGFRGPNGMPQQHHMVTGEGSGFFISADGYAVTNNHVVDHANSVQVTADDGTIYTAKVVGRIPRPISR
jgi:serine protease Do